MSEQTWETVDRYISDLMIGDDPVLAAALGASDAAGLPAIAVSPAQGKFLYLLARMQGARAILEIGTLGGYSTIWLGRSLPAGGRLVSLELDPKHADVARGNVERAGLGDCVTIRVGRALDTLAEMLAEGDGPFDLIFIDADKAGYPDYLRWALKFSRRGTMIVADNVVRDGEVADAASADPSVQGARRFNALLAAEPRIESTVIQTVGVKGYDGFAFGLVVKDT